MATPAPSFPPVVWEPVKLIDLIQHILNRSIQSATLVVCSTREAFLNHLRSSNSLQQPGLEGSLSDHAQAELLRHESDPWTVPTLRLLASSSRVKLVFCSTVTHLRAHLATYGIRKRNEARNDSTFAGQFFLIVVNPISLHRSTSAFSAQGLNRTFAIAVEAAARANNHLALVECLSEPEQNEEVNNAEDPSTAMVRETNPWDQEVSILNVTTKTFGAGERGWAGRTVKIRNIAERWCLFENLATTHG